MEESCDEQTAAAIEGDRGYRWGLDPSTYFVGFNVYEHTLTLTQGGETLNEDTLRFEVTATH
jgi:hypothetical protein